MMLAADIFKQFCTAIIEWWWCDAIISISFNTFYCQDSIWTPSVGVRKKKEKRREKKYAKKM